MRPIVAFAAPFVLAVSVASADPPVTGTATAQATTSTTPASATPATPASATSGTTPATPASATSGTTPAISGTAPASNETPAHPASPYAIAIAEGYTKLRENDPQNAQLAFQRAVAADGSKSEGHYLLGVAMRRNGSTERAVEEFRTATSLAQQANDLVGEARARIALAETLTPHEHHAAAAREAWNELVAFAEHHPDVLPPEIPRGHLQAIARVAELATQMEPVRHRIAAREREAREREAHPAPAHRARP